jgi:hypothetical protein
MRREFTAISALSMAISFVAAVVLCLQVAQIKSAPEWQISGPTAWAVEIAIFGTAVYAWRSGISLSGWMLGILVLVFLRLALATAAALALNLFQGVTDLTLALDRTATLGPRVCTALFALMIFYPLRVLLPVRSVGKRSTKRFAESAAAVSAAGPRRDGDPALVLVGGDQAIPVWDTRAKGSLGNQPQDLARPLMELEGTVEVPLRPLLAQVPEDLWGENVHDYDESHPVPIPLEVIIPQLREARIVARLGDLHEWLPPGTMRAPLEFDLEREAALVILPLEWIVPQLPPEALELPPPSPPAWAKVSETESVLFATV